MMRHLLLTILIILVVACVQFGVLVGLSPSLACVVLPLVLLPFATYSRLIERIGIFPVVVIGIVWDSVSPYSFGAYTTAFLVTLIASAWFFEVVVTNTSFASYVVLSTCAIGVFYAVFFAMLVVGNDIPDWSTLSYQMNLMVSPAIITLALSLAGYAVARNAAVHTSGPATLRL